MQKIKISMFVLAVSLYANLAGAQPSQLDAQLLLQLQDTIRQQQEQLRKQAEALDALQKQVNELKQATGDIQDQAARAVTTAQQAVVAGKKNTPLVTSGKERVKLSISGQVNRALNFTNDGKRTETYFVDHATSGSRINFVATARMSDDLSLGSRIELAITPDNSSQVSQSTPTPGDSFNQRWAEVSLISTQWGKLSLGKGDTASNTTAEVDLSGTLAVQNSSVADLFYGMLFRERAGDQALTGIKVSNAFSNLDGLHRESRLRYDTPRYHGFRLAASSVSNRRSDAAVFWDGQGYGFRAAAAAAMADPNLDRAGNRYDGSFSLLHDNSGLNFTLSAGLQERDNQADDGNLYGKFGWLANFNGYGKTAFVVDYTRSENLPAARDVGHSLGVGMVQFFDKYDTEVYLQYRRYSLDRNSGAKVEDIQAGSVGARVRF
ncbi:MAG: hypothetical protein WC091_20690 [Sulfuricellaceae bacterium]